MQQLSLNVTLQDGFEFETFYPTAVNEELYTLLKTACWQEYPQVFLFGQSGSGKSHLLQACCHAQAQRGKQSFYMPLRVFAQHGVGILQGTEAAALLALDDVDAVVGQAEWDEALFHLINQRRSAGQTIIFSADSNPRGFGHCLPDLVSRYLWGPIYQVHALDDQQAMQVFQQRAHHRGLMISPQISNYLRRHTRRDMASLMQLLERLDTATLSDKKRLTLKLVREAMHSA